MDFEDHDPPPSSDNVHTTANDNTGNCIMCRAVSVIAVHRCAQKDCLYKKYFTDVSNFDMILQHYGYRLLTDLLEYKDAIDPQGLSLWIQTKIVDLCKIYEVPLAQDAGAAETSVQSSHPACPSSLSTSCPSIVSSSVPSSLSSSVLSLVSSSVPSSASSFSSHTLFSSVNSGFTSLGVSTSSHPVCPSSNLSSTSVLVQSCPSIVSSSSLVSLSVPSLASSFSSHTLFSSVSSEFTSLGLSTTTFMQYQQSSLPTSLPYNTRLQKKKQKATIHLSEPNVSLLAIPSSSSTFQDLHPGTSSLLTSNPPLAILVASTHLASPSITPLHSPLGSLSSDSTTGAHTSSPSIALPARSTYNIRPRKTVQLPLQVRSPDSSQVEMPSVPRRKKERVPCHRSCNCKRSKCLCFKKKDTSAGPKRKQR